MLGISEKHEPLDYRMSGGCGDVGVLDLRINIKEDYKRWGWEADSSRSTSPQSEGFSPTRIELCNSPTLAIAQRVLSAGGGQGKQTRPFKAYPKDPSALSSSDAYVQFRETMLSQVRANKSYPKKRCVSPQQQQPSSSGEGGNDEKDAAYWERRRKNNEAAKRSRDARRAKEDEIAIRAAFLEQENLKLRYQIAALTDETAKLRCMIYNS
jgi:bZIP factor